MSGEEITATARFQEKCRELERLLAEFEHDAWKRGILESPADDGADHPEMPVRMSARLLAGAFLRATEARLRTLAALAGQLSEGERQSLKKLLRIPAAERRTIAALLRLGEDEREQLAAAFSLSVAECSALGAFFYEGTLQQDARADASKAGPRRSSSKKRRMTDDEAHSSL